MKTYPLLLLINQRVFPQTDYSRQHYADPFDPSTPFSFSFRSSIFTNLTVYDVLDRQIVTLVNEKLGSGEYIRQWDASRMASGVYFYRFAYGK